MKKTVYFILSFSFICVSLIAETFRFEAPVEGQYATDLSNALSSANDSDIFVLGTPNGTYLFKNMVTINANILIKSEDFNQPSTLKINDGNTLFTLSDEKTMELVALKVDGISNTDSLSHLITVNNNYSFISRNCTFQHLKSGLINGDNSIGTLLFLENTTSIGTPLTSSYNAQFQTLKIESSIFINTIQCPLSVEASSSTSSAFINHCVFDNVAPNNGDTLLDITASSNIIIKNSSFSNNSYAATFVLDEGAELDYNNFYNSTDWGNLTGVNCTYYNPQYDTSFFVTNTSLSSKGDDGETIGPLLWIYSDEIVEEEIDLGNNPYNFENQGVWIVPEVDETGLWESYFVKRKDNKLWYREDEKGNTIPDFSYCGYRMGNEELPSFPIVATVRHIEGDALDYIQAVIDSVAQHTILDEQGVRGAILIKSGIYNISGTLNLNASGIVLRGEGNSETEGTVLVATSTSGSLSNQEKLIRIGNSSGSLQTNSGVNISVPYIPVGAKHVIVAKGHSFSEGEQVAIYQVFNDKLIEDLGMNDIANRPDGTPSTQWVASDYKYYFEREVRRISSAGANGDSIIFYNPIVNALDQEYNATRKLYKASYPSRINNSGIENMLLKSVYASDEDENHTWSALYFDRAEHCWAKNISSKYFAFGLANISRYSKHITIDGGICLSPKSVITGSRRYSFNIDGQMCVVKNCYSSEGRHDYVQGSKVCGPNVFTNSIAENANEDIGPHHRWSTGTLYDKLTTDNTINVQDRGYYGSGHGWAGGSMVFWGCSGKSSICQNPQVYAQNYNIGFIGQYIEMQTFGNRPRGQWEGNNVEGLNIPSLYEEQRKARGFDVEFGLLTSNIGYVNDSTFRLSFNDTLNEATAIKVSNYTAWGSAGISGSPETVRLIDNSSVELIYKSIGILTYNTRMDLEISNIKNKKGNTIVSNNTASLSIPDIRPIVTMSRQTVTNSALDYVTLSSNKSGHLYLAFVTINPQSIDDLENGIAENKVAITRNISQNTEAQISTHQLLAGLYYAYATDKEGRISGKSSNYVLINTASGLDKAKTSSFADVSYSSTNQNITVKLENAGLNKIAIYDLSGRLIYSNESSNTMLSFNITNEYSVVIVKINQGDKMLVRKLIIN